MNLEELLIKIKNKYKITIFNNTKQLKGILEDEIGSLRNEIGNEDTKKILDDVEAIILILEKSDLYDNLKKEDVCINDFKTKFFERFNKSYLDKSYLEDIFNILAKVINPEQYKKTLINNKCGNTLNNIANMGLACKANDWIFYCNKDKLYKMKINNPENPIKVSNHRADYINIVNNWVFYSNRNKLHRKKISEDNKSNLKEKSYISLEMPRNIIVIDDWIIYSDSKGIHKVNAYGEEGEETKEDITVKVKGLPCIIDSINISGDWIIYPNFNDGEKLYKIKLDGSKHIKLTNDVPLCINVLDDWVFYINKSKNNRLYKVKINDSNPIELKLEDSIERLNVVDNWIFYSNDKGELYKAEIDDSKGVKLSDNKAYYINVIDDWIFYNNKKSLYMIRVDKSEERELD